MRRASGVAICGHPLTNSQFSATAFLPLSGMGMVNEQESERILRRVGLWEQGVRVCSGADPPPEPILEPWLDAPFPACHGVAQRRRDDDAEPAMEYVGN